MQHSDLGDRGHDAASWTPYNASAQSSIMRDVVRNIARLLVDRCQRLRFQPMTRMGRLRGGKERVPAHTKCIYSFVAKRRLLTNHIAAVIACDSTFVQLSRHDPLKRPRRGSTARRHAASDYPATKPGNLTALASKVAVARHPSLRWRAPIRQSAKSAALSFQR